MMNTTEIKANRLSDDDRRFILLTNRVEIVSSVNGFVYHINHMSVFKYQEKTKTLFINRVFITDVNSNLIHNIFTNKFCLEIKKIIYL